MTTDQLYALGQFINIVFIPHIWLYGGMIIAMLLLLTVYFYLQNVFTKLEELPNASRSETPRSDRL